MCRVRFIFHAIQLSATSVGDSIGIQPHSAAEEEEEEEEQNKDELD